MEMKIGIPQNMGNISRIAQTILFNSKETSHLNNGQKERLELENLKHQQDIQILRKK